MVTLVLKASEEGCVEDRRRELADSTANTVDQVAVDDRARRNETFVPGALADVFVERERLARLDDVALG